MKQEVTERDLRMPEFRDAKLEDLEFRDDGKIVRKDRWEMGIRRIVGILGFDTREGFEIPDVVNAVAELTKDLECDVCGEPFGAEENPFHHTGILNGKPNTHIHLCAKCEKRLSPPTIDFDDLLGAGPCQSP